VKIKWLFFLSVAVLAGVLWLKTDRYSEKIEKKPTLEKENITAVIARKKEKILLEKGNILQLENKNDPAAIIAHLEILEECNTRNDCNVKQNDPRSAFFSIGRAMSNDLRLLAELKSKSKEYENQARLLASRLLGFENDEVRESALLFLATVPPVPENVDAIISGLSLCHDAAVFRIAIKEFARYHESASREKISQFLGEVILTGGHYAAQEVAKNLLPLMDEISISYYQSLLEQMPEKTKKYRLLKNTVKQYKLHLQGG
jgi:hypothetical protein